MTMFCHAAVPMVVVFLMSREGLSRAKALISISILLIKAPQVGGFVCVCACAPVQGGFKEGRVVGCFNLC